MTLKQATHVCLALLAVSGLLAGCAAPPAPTAPAAGPATLAAPVGPTSSAPSATLPPSATAEPTQAVPTATAAGPTPVPGKAALVSLRGEAVFAADGWGNKERQVLSLGSAAAVALHGAQLAYVDNGSVLVADLNGSAPRRLADAPPAFLLGPDLVWTADGQAILTVADREDPNARETGRSLDIGIVGLEDGTWRPGLSLADRVGVTILQAPSPSGQVLLVAWGAEPSFTEALRYDLATGQLLARVPIAGGGEIVPSPDDKAAVTTLFDEGKGANVNLLYDLAQDSLPVRQRLALQPDTHTAGHLWSPDGKRIAYLLRRGRAPSEAPAAGLGIWIWDVEEKKTARVAEVTDPAAGPVAWTPDGRYLLYRDADASGANAFYALDTAGNSVQRLPLDPASRILGWIPGVP